MTQKSSYPNKKIFLYGKLREVNDDLDQTINDELGLGPVFESCWNDEGELVLRFFITLPYKWDRQLNDMEIPKPYADLVLGNTSLPYLSYPVNALELVSFRIKNFKRWFLENTRFAQGDSIKEMKVSYAHGLTLYITFD